MAKQSKEKMRNLKQYKDMSEDDFDKLWESRVAGIQQSTDFEARINRKLEEFAQDYDIDDLKINDKETLRALVQAIIALEDWEQISFRLRTDSSLDNFDVAAIDKLSKLMSDLRKDIGSLQNDLNITRKIRKSDKEATVVNYIEDLKQKAKIFYESRTSYVVCPKCNMLLATLWTLYPEENNKLTLTCNRILDNGDKCGEKFTVTSSELLENRGVNVESVLPESMT